MQKLIFAALVAAGLSSPAFAQDAAPQGDRDFTGFRIEGLIGYDNVALPGVKNPDGVLYGIGVGYDFNLGGAVLGLEADVTDSTAKLNIPGPDVVTDRDIYVGARIGAKLGSGLIYGKGGYTNARLESGSFHDNSGGFRLGAGYELPVSGNSFAKVEYRYSNYKEGVARNQLVAGFGVRF
jgi:outer membrane immunogenic protein